MKIGILTFPNSPSYGATLQMCGLYSTLKEFGCEVEIINYRNTFMTKKKHILKHNENFLKKYIFIALDIPSKLKFKKFEKNMTTYPDNIITEKDNLEIISNRYDYLICGSDQVWNPFVTGEDLNYFFKFCKENSKKISYAASFGVEKLTEEFSSKVKEELKKFKNISIREKEGAKIIENLLDYECPIVLDPSMLLTQEKWEKMQKKVKGLPKKYIAKFIFNYDNNVEEKILELSKKTKLPVVVIGGTLFSKFKKGIFTGNIGPTEWLYVLNNAEYVVTDSFHGAAFSIIFHKKLYVSLASSTNSRLKTLLHTFELNDRIISEKLSFEEIDYQKVQKIMIKKREESLDYLKNSIRIGE